MPAARGADASAADTGTLTFNTQIDVRYPSASCAAGTPFGVECYDRTGTGVIRGLGRVNESMTYQVESAPAGCNSDDVRVLPTTARFSVPGKGEIELSIGGSACVPRGLGPLRAEADFTITGGSGRYVGASGQGRYIDLSNGPPSFRGRDTWTGTLVVPGLEFDITPPTISGAVAKTVRAPRGAKRARVVYAVSARDAVDGAVPVSCVPRSGSRFAIGRTVVSCSATDTSGNTRTARFTVTVRPRRSAL